MKNKFKLNANTKYAEILATIIRYNLKGIHPTRKVVNVDVFQNDSPGYHSVSYRKLKNLDYIKNLSRGNLVSYNRVVEVTHMAMEKGDKFQREVFKNVIRDIYK